MSLRLFHIAIVQTGIVFLCLANAEQGSTLTGVPTDKIVACDSKSANSSGMSSGNKTEKDTSSSHSIGCIESTAESPDTNASHSGLLPTFYPESANSTVNYSDFILYTLRGESRSLWLGNGSAPIPPTEYLDSTTPYEPRPDFQEFLNRNYHPFETVKDDFPGFELQAAALHAEVCGTMCFFPHAGAIYGKAMACAECHCDSLCHNFHDCCPDKQLLEPAGERKRIGDVYTCEPSTLKPKMYSSTEELFFSMINFCPSDDNALVDFLGTTVQTSNASSSSDPSSPSSGAQQKSQRLLKEKCENRNESIHWDFMQPMTSPGGLVYRNRFCAECHGENRENLTKWTIGVLCDADLLYNAHSPSEAYFLAARTPGCDVRFYGPIDNGRECSFSGHHVISSCNETGLWEFYDEEIERACASFVSLVLNKYKNVFCYLCNTMYGFQQLQHSSEFGPESPTSNVARASFYALLNFDDEGSQTGGSEEMSPLETKEDQCPRGAVKDALICGCRPLECAKGLQLEGDKCTSMFSTNYFGFTVCSHYQLKSSHEIDFDDFSDFMWQITTFSGQATIKQAIGFPQLDCHDNTILRAEVTMKIQSHLSENLNELAAQILHSLQDTVRMMTAYSPFNVTVVLLAQGCLSFDQWPPDIPDSCPTKSGTLAMRVVDRSGPQTYDDEGQVAYSALLNTTLCPRVTLSEAEFQNFTWKLVRVGGSLDNVTRDTMLNDNNQTVYYVCAEHFRMIESVDDGCGQNTLQEFVLAKSSFTDTWTTLGVTSVVCTCVSLLCLLCVIVTYLVLSPLRAGTGLSTLAMACLLFLAQTFHEFGIEQFEFHEVCLFLSLLIHFLWLSVVFMMTCCTFQLFFLLVFPLKARLCVASRKILLTSLAFSFGLATAIIVLTILGNYASFGDIGYPSQYLCFIDRSLSRLLAFGLPMGLAVVVNIVLFVITVTHIRRRPKVSSTRHDRVSLAACFRLSVITGCTWLSLFLLVVPGTRPWLEYVFVALLGFQGLLLASTLLINARVCRLWRDFLARRGNKSFMLHLSGSDSARDTRSMFNNRTKETEFGSNGSIKSNN